MASNFIWYELMTSDLEAAESFYKAMVGWQTEDFPGQGFRYVVAKAGDRGIGGMMSIPAEAASMGARPCWLGYIHTADVDAATAALKADGGTVHREPADIPEVGRFSVVADPQGATFIMMTPKGPDLPPLPRDVPGQVSWNELYAADWPSALDFYSRHFGWTKGEGIDMGPMGTYQLFHAGGEAPAGGMMNKTPEVPAPMWNFYFAVPDIHAAAKRVTENGGTVIMAPMEVPDGWAMQGLDPQGAVFGLAAGRG